MRTALLAISVTIAALAQTQPAPPPAPPAPPACLSGPVSLGSITLTCAALDGTNNIPGDNSNVAGNYYFQVRITSSDPEVLAVRVKITTWQGAFQPGQRTAAISPTGSVFVYTFNLGATFDSNGQQIPPIVSSVTVQELKGSSTQTF